MNFDQFNPHRTTPCRSMNAPGGETSNPPAPPGGGVGTGHNWRELATAHLLCTWQDRLAPRNNPDPLAAAAAALGNYGLAQNPTTNRASRLTLPPIHRDNVRSNATAPDLLGGRHSREISYDLMPLPPPMPAPAPSASNPSSYQEILRFMNAIDMLAVSRFGVTYRELVDIKDEVERELAMVREGATVRLLSRLRAPPAVGAAIRGNFANQGERREASPGSDRKPAAAAVEHHTSVSHESNDGSKTDEDNGEGVSKSDSHSSPWEPDQRSAGDAAPDVCLPIGTDVEIKRHRRKCAVAACPNRVVQGGVCISHGAKRKTCSHPGCEKTAKKKGKCSAHGPLRKRCEREGCEKVAVQGGRCISHGAKKKDCMVEDCTKQSIMGGMCTRHYKEHHGIKMRQANPKKRKAKPEVPTETPSKEQKRRKCSVTECPNRVVQGGLCMAHGAKRKTCDVPGCTKNVKKHGKCSAHGPERKRCEVEGCEKVAVQGGKCIGHGAKTAKTKRVRTKEPKSQESPQVKAEEMTAKSEENTVKVEEKNSVKVEEDTAIKVQVVSESN